MGRKGRPRSKAVAALATAAALVAAAGVYATVLTVSARDDAGGTGDVPICQPTDSPVQVQSDDPVYDAGLTAWVTSGVTVSNINADCQDIQLGLYLTAHDVNGRALKSVGPQLIEHASEHLDLPDGIKMSDLDGWTIAFHPIAVSIPSGLVAEAASATSVALSWTAPSVPDTYPVTDYTVEYSANDGGSWQTFGHDPSDQTSSTVSGLTGGGTYLFRVSAVSGAGTGNPTPAKTVRLVVPGQPTDLEGAASSSTSLHLTWTAPTPRQGAPVTDYTIEYSTNGTDWTSFSDDTSTDPSATVTGLTVSTAYRFRVSAVNAVGTGDPATTGEIVTETAPSEPRFVSGVSESSHEVLLTWTAPADDGGSAITDYVVQYAADDGIDTWVTFDDVVSTQRSATVTGLTNGTAYYFRVRAKNANGTGPSSTSQPLVTPAGPPSAPSPVTTTAGVDHIDVTWTAPATTGGVSIVGYVASTPVGAGNTASCSTTTALDCAITGLSPNTAYTVTVTATNAAGRTSSATDDTQTLTTNTVPGTPTAVSGTPQDSAVRVTWTAPASDGGLAITSYTVTSTPDGKTCTSSGALACTVADLTNGTPYTFSVTATNSEGTGAGSDPSDSITPATVPGTPTDLTPTSPGTSGRIDLDWTEPTSDGGSDLTDYLVQYSTDDGATWTDMVRAASTSTSASSSNFDDLKDYRFRVAAVNVIGAGAFSATSDPVAPTDSDGAPGPVSAIAATAEDDGAILTWTAPAYLGASVTGYEVQYKCTRVPGARQDHCGDTAPYQEWSDWYPTGSAATGAELGYGGVNDGELFDGNDYVFRVRALIDQHTGVSVQTTVPVQPAEGCVPNAPTSVTATDNSTTSIGLSWTRDPGGPPVGNPPIGCQGVPIDPRTHYHIKYETSADGSTWSAMSDPIDTRSIATTFQVTDLSEGTWYRFIVQEWPDNDNRSAWSSVSNEVQTGTTVVAPGRPTGITGTAGDGQAAASWTAPAGTGGAAIDSYRVTAYTDEAGTVPATGMTNPQSIASGDNFTGLANGTSYYLRVEAHNSAGWGAASDPSAAVTPRTTPDAPTALTSDATAGDGTVSLSWTAPEATGGAPVTDYVVQYSADDGASWSTFGHDPIATPGVVVTGLSTGRAYLFRVAAMNAAGIGSMSANSDPATPYSAPSAPTSLVGTPQAGLAVGATETYVNLSWAAPLDNGGSTITGYTVQVSTDAGASWSTPTFSSPTETSAQVTGLPVSTPMQLRVRAVTAATRVSDASYLWATTSLTTATPPAPLPAVPNAVTNLAANPGDTVVALTWTASATTGAAVTGYSVRYSSNGGGTWSTPVTTAATSMAVSGLTNNTAYRFEVTPTSSSGPGPAATVDATPVASTLRAPQAVRNLAAAPGVLVAGLTWTAPATSQAHAPVTGYVVQRSTDHNSWTTVATLGSSQVTYLASGLTAGRTYYFRVFATSAVGNGSIAAYVTTVPVASNSFQTVAGSAAWTDGTVVLQSGTSLLSQDTKSDVTLTATASMAVSPVGTGYGLWVRSTFTNNQISGYSFQVDPGQGNNFVLRWWTNGKERGTPWAQTKFPAGFDPNAPHVVSVTVKSGVLTATVDGVTVMTTTLPKTSETVNGVTFTPNDGGRYGFRTWYPTVATVTAITAKEA